VRLIGQYTSNLTDLLRDDSRTNGAILLRDPVSGASTRTVWRSRLPSASAA
jgi:hypothetical protein